MCPWQRTFLCLVSWLAFALPAHGGMEGRVCTYQDEALKEGACGYLAESSPVYDSVLKGGRKHYHFRVEDLSLINDESPKFHLRVSPCVGGVSVYVKTNPFPWPSASDFRYEANNTEYGSIKEVYTPLYNRDYYITVVAETDSNYTLVAFTNRDRQAMPVKGGNAGILEVEQKKLTVPAISVIFHANDWDRNAMYQVFKAKIVDGVAAGGEEDADGAKATAEAQKDMPVCTDFSGQEPCKIMYTACGIEEFGEPIDDGGYEPRENNSKIMKIFRGEPGDKYFINVVVVGQNGIKTAYRGAQAFIANKPEKSAVDSDTQITVVAIVASVFGALALAMAFAMFKMRKAVNMKDPSKKKKKKTTAAKSGNAKQEIGNILRGVVPGKTVGVPAMSESTAKKSASAYVVKPPGAGPGPSPSPGTAVPGPPPRPSPGTAVPGPPPRPSPGTAVPGPPPRPSPGTAVPGPPPRPSPGKTVPGPPPRPRLTTTTSDGASTSPPKPGPPPRPPGGGPPGGTGRRVVMQKPSDSRPPPPLPRGGRDDGAKSNVGTTEEDDGGGK